MLFQPQRWFLWKVRRWMVKGCHYSAVAHALKGPNESLNFGGFDLFSVYMEVGPTVHLHWGTVFQECPEPTFLLRNVLFFFLSLRLSIWPRGIRGHLQELKKIPLRGFRRYQHMTLSSLPGNVTSTSTWTLLHVCDHFPGKTAVAAEKEKDKCLD